MSHDCYVVQIPRIQPKLQSKLEVLLTIFEQDYFTDDKEITKDYTYKVDNDLIKNIIDILHHAGTDPIERLEIEKEQEALRVFDAGMRELKDTIAEKEKALSEKDRLIEELLKKLGEK